MNALLKQLDKHFETLRDKTAVRDDISQQGITYGQLDELSGRVYCCLKKHDIGREDTVLKKNQGTMRRKMLRDFWR